ncbi:MAG: hypothetical protein DIZ80_08115 [endosymbiont of Galathealinum brachiosum]|uniref:Protochlamydia outer membrane protein domain-containing protein n=1 Tax=endosymbiont of Galathealinum brachiosum TaxID=2200906 RepID=A0A370DIG5_9GAMM|nr:MAG: hypothetical protein DIZ80_08115 [endosymbiont of Galathealinum brachiosum]
MLASFQQLFAAENSIDITTQVKKLNYTEYADDNSVIVRESGKLPGLGIKINHSLPSIKFAINADVFAGLVDYKGQTQTGTPHTTKTDTVISNVGLSMQLQLIPKQHFITAGYSANLWLRDILPNNGVQALYETYRWSTIKLGYENHFRTNSHLFISGIKYLQHANSEMKIDFNGINPTAIPLKNATGWQGYISYIYGINKKWQFSMQYQHQQWSSNKSETVQVDSQFGQLLINEPRSKTSNDDFKISLIYQF